jgi:hypothetical protein
VRFLNIVKILALNPNKLLLKAYYPLENVMNEQFSMICWRLVGTISILIPVNDCSK